MNPPTFASKMLNAFSNVIFNVETPRLTQIYKTGMVANYASDEKHRFGLVKFGFCFR